MVPAKPYLIHETDSSYGLGSIYNNCKESIKVILSNSDLKVVDHNYLYQPILVIDKPLKRYTLKMYVLKTKLNIFYLRDNDFKFIYKNESETMVDLNKYQFVGYTSIFENLSSSERLTKSLAISRNISIFINGEYANHTGNQDNTLRFDDHSDYYDTRHKLDHLELNIKKDIPESSVTNRPAREIISMIQDLAKQAYDGGWDDAMHEEYGNDPDFDLYDILYEIDNILQQAL